MKRGRPRKYFTEEEKRIAATNSHRRWKQRNLEKFKLSLEESRRRRLSSDPDYFKNANKARYAKNRDRIKLCMLNKYYSGLSIEGLKKAKIKAESRLSLICRLLAQKELEKQQLNKEKQS